MFYGIDGCRGGWCLAGLDAVGVRVLEVVPSFAEAARRTREATAVFVDIPIGLPDGKAVLFRTCDRLAKDELGPRGSSVFSVPVRPALEAPSYEEANRIQLRFTGQGLSRQSYALAPRILEVDAILRGGTLHGGRGGALHGGLLRGEPPNDLAGKVFESHPELCFARLNGGRPLRWPKRETLGVLERARLLRPFIGDPWAALDRVSDASTGALAAGPSSIDDVLDALVLAVHARLSAGHGLTSLPAEPEHDVYGLPMRIVTADVTFVPPPGDTAGPLSPGREAGGPGPTTADATTLWLIRHGETEWNRGGRMQGQADTPLSETGVEQARRIADRLRGRSFAGLYASDLRRAAQTAEIIGEAVGLKAALLPALREVDLGELSGLSGDEVKERYPHLFGKNRRPEDRRPGGESDLEHHMRVWTAIQALAGDHPGQEILVVTHGGTVRSAISAALGSPPGRLLPLVLGNASISVLVHRFGTWNLDLLNDTCHLR